MTPIVSLSRYIESVVSDSESAKNLSDEKIETPDIAVTNTMMSLKIQKFLEKLNPREETILKMRYGLLHDKNYTLDEIGIYFSLTRERIVFILILS